MPAAPFSRLALAAALIEYDNDKDDPSKPPKSAQDSAIFLPFRNIPIRPERKSTDYLGVSLPSETGDSAPRPTSRSSGAFDRKSRASIDALRNPFGRDSTYDAGYEDEEEEEDLEVDLASWGLDALVPKEEKGKEKEKRKKNKFEALPNPHDNLGRGRPPHMRTMSGNLLNGLGEGGAFLDSQPSTNSLGARRHSIGDPLDAPMAYDSNPILPPRARSPSAHALIDNLALSNPLHAVPFPSSETIRSPTPGADRQRTFSLGSRGMLNDEFRPTSPDRASRLDHGRTYSSGSITKMLDGPQPEEDNPFALRPPSPSRMSRFDPKAQRARTLSQGTLATQMMLDDEPAPRPGAASRPSMGEHRYSRMDLMRPKVLIMPSPLQSTVTPAAPPPVRVKEGFELSTDGRPLPPGARAGRRASVSMSVLEPGGLSTPVASNSFTPNPRASLTLSQLIFRNTLLVDGQRDVAYADIEGHLKRATEDGQKIEPDPEPIPDALPEVPIVHADEPTGPKRPAGKLYGRSLIDNLEARKAEMRGKQRVFRGDDRPSMMARSQTGRSSTLINPDELKRPASQHMNSFNSAPDLARRNSANAKPLLDFEDEIPGAPRQSLLPGGLGTAGATRSVFGVDTLWERELAKLKEIEEQERQAEEERRKREAEEEAKNKKKGKKKKGKGKEREGEPPISPTPQTPSPAIPESASSPPVLPAIPKTIVKRAPPPPADDDDDDDDDDSDSSDAPVQTRAQTSGWHSDEEEGPRRTTGTGLRYPNTGGPPRLPQIPGARDDDDSSEEDVPLVATIGRAAQRQARSRVGDDDSSDEEKPLIVLLDKTKQKLPSLGGGGSSLAPHSPTRAGGGGDDDDEDDKPLGLRVSHFGSLNPSLAGGNGDDDDKPLALHPEQLRKSQYFMAAQQQQQQQMLAQAQMAQMAAAHQSMIFGAPSMMSSGFFAPPPMAPPMMMYPQLPPTPPPMQDATKFVRVDKWRHDVAVEGERS
ncbi:hypothetical protein K466DRAFT_599802 [Polyporus arcularius HHB13444]|uniref:Uncharacterized protein n=1 Tax=Polyporus arcularius HHB13444 TaxID=1314778 RepID=A0A5C3PBP8_9APHY|nr:hypothetical protein K466DRAFT_599802 [Polyporus arcularius HHB13444]